MNLENLQTALQRRPFKPFEIRVGGDVLTVEHPEQVLVTSEGTTVVVADQEEHLHIFDTDRISKINLLKNRRAGK